MNTETITELQMVEYLMGIDVLMPDGFDTGWSIFEDAVEDAVGTDSGDIEKNISEIAERFPKLCQLLISVVRKKFPEHQHCLEYVEKIGMLV